VSRTRCGVQRRCAEPGPTPHRSLADTGPRLCSAPPKWRCAASGARAVSRAHISLHAVIASAAKQSRISPRRRSGLLRRCAPRNDGRAETASVSQLASPCRHTFAFSRRISPELCFNVPHLFRKRVQGRPGAGWHPWSVRKGMHTGWTTGQPRFGLPCAVVLTASFVLSPGSDALLPPSSHGWLKSAPGRAAHLTARLDAQTPGARTTRLLRPRTVSPDLRKLACARLRCQ